MNDQTMTTRHAAPGDTATPTSEFAVATSTGLRFLDGSVELADRDVRAVVDSPSGAFALGDGVELHARVDGHWSAVARLTDGVGRCIGVHGGEVYVGGGDARLWRLVGGQLARVVSFDRAPTSDDWHTPWGGPPDVYSMASDGTHLFVGVHVGGILRWTDSEGWEPTIDLHDDVHQVALADDGTVWAATGMRALASSTDAGSTWTYFRSGLHGTYALAVAAGSAGPLVSVSSGPSARDGRVYRLVDDRLIGVDGLPDDLDGAVGPRKLAAAGRRAAVGLPNGDIYVSDDGGATWSRAFESAGEVHEVALFDRR